MHEINPAQWLVLVYMAGDNNINDRCIDNLKQMQQVGSTENVKVLVQFDPRKEGVKTKRFLISKQGPNGSLDQDVVESLDETDTGDPRVLEDFLRWGINKNPKARILVILWGHGNGMDDDKPTAVGKDALKLIIKSEVLIRSISQPEFKVATAFGDDEHPQDFLSNDELKTVFNNLSAEIEREIDIVGFDSCLMSMAEVYYQLRSSVGLAVGAEGVTPSSSWPYHRILHALVERPTMEPREVADLIVSHYISHYSDYDDMTVDLSVSNLRLGERLAEVVANLAAELKRKVSDPEIDNSTRIKVRNAIHIAHFFAQQYYGDVYVDLFDFCQLLHESCDDEDVQKVCREVMILLDKRNEQFVLRSEHTGEDVTPYGLSIYFPFVEVNEVYKTLEFPRRTGWVDFLTTYIDRAEPARLPEAVLK